MNSNEALSKSVVSYITKQIENNFPQNGAERKILINNQIELSKQFKADFVEKASFDKLLVDLIKGETELDKDQI